MLWDDVSNIECIRVLGLYLLEHREVWEPQMSDAGGRGREQREGYLEWLMYSAVMEECDISPGRRPGDQPAY